MEKKQQQKNGLLLNDHVVQWAGLQSTPPPCTAGMEVAAYLADKAASISCIDITAVPFERVLGARVGGILQGVSGAV